MISASLDGEVISGISNRFGLLSVRGSSSFQGKEALSKLVNFVKDGGKCAFTVDGPRGPRLQVKAGTLALSQRTGAPILPMAVIPSRYITLWKSWDKSRIPLPFSRLNVLYGPPITVPRRIRSTDLDQWLQKLAEELNKLEQQAKQLG